MYVFGSGRCGWRGGKWMRELGLGFTNHVGTGGVLDMYWTRWFPLVLNCAAELYPALKLMSQSLIHGSSLNRLKEQPYPGLQSRIQNLPKYYRPLSLTLPLLKSLSGLLEKSICCFD